MHIRTNLTLHRIWWLSAYNFCKQFESRLGSIKCRASPGARFTNVLSAKKFVSSFLRTVCVSQTPSTYEFLKDFAKIFLNIVVTLRQGGGDLIFKKIS